MTQREATRRAVPIAAVIPFLLCLAGCGGRVVAGPAAGARATSAAAMPAAHTATQAGPGDRGLIPAPVTPAPTVAAPAPFTATSGAGSGSSFPDFSAIDQQLAAADQALAAAGAGLGATEGDPTR